MGKLLSLSLRWHMILLVIVMTVVPLGIIAKSAFNQRQHDLREANLSVERLVNEVANDQQVLLSGAEQVLSTVGYLPSVQQHDAAAVNPLLAELIKKSPQLTNILMIDAQGRVWASALTMRGPTTAHDRRFFKNALATGNFSSGEFTIGRVLNKPAFSLGYPIKDRVGRITDVATVAFTLSKYDELLKLKKMSDNASLVLVDHRGTILFSSVGPQFAGTPDVLFKQMTGAADSGNFEAIGNSGTRRLHAYKKLRLEGEQTPYLYVRAGIAKTPLVSKTNQALLVDVGLMLLVLILALAITIYISRRGVLDKISALQQATRRVAAGDLEVRVADFVSGGELGELGHSFDAMTQALIEQTRDRQQAEAEVRDKERLLREAQRIGHLGTYDFNIREDYWLSSPEMDEIFGIPAAYSKSFGSWLTLIHPADRDRMQRYFATLLASESWFDMEYRICRYDDGTVRWVYGTGEFTRDPDGQPVRMIGTIQDITERKALEIELRDLNHELEQRVQERTAELEESIREQEAFNYSVSHDLRAPLRHINSYSVMLQEEVGAVLPDTARAYLERIQTASNRMGDLIDDLLQLSRVGRVGMRQVPVNLSQLALQVVELLQSSDPERQVSVQIGNDLMVQGDPTLLRLTLENLLSNAWKYSAKKAAARIEFDAITLDGKEVFMVRDNGAGFNMAYADKLFHPFQRLHGAEYEGTGIGLSIVRRVIERHGGKVWAEAREGVGATIYFTLPPQQPGACAPQ